MKKNQEGYYAFDKLTDAGKTLYAELLLILKQELEDVYVSTTSEQAIDIVFNYLMIDHPEMSAMDCLRESKRMTQGYKGQLFVLDLSFLLWLILCALPVIGYAAQIYVTPYKEAAHVYYYEIVKADELGRERFSYNV